MKNAAKKTTKKTTKPRAQKGSFNDNKRKQDKAIKTLEILDAKEEDGKIADELKAEATRLKTKKAKATKKAKPAKAAKKTAEPKQTKGATILALIARKGGATAAELQQASGWQAHSVRGFLSVATKKGLAKISSAKNEAGERVYSA